VNEERLARVRRVRELQERALRAEWATAERAANDAEDIVTLLAELRSGSGVELAQRVVVGSVDVLQMVRDGESLDRLDAAVVAARTRAQGARRTAEQRRAPWQQRRMEAEGLRRIEERQRALRRAEVLEREQTTQDEQSGMRHTRRSAERAPEDERDQSEQRGDGAQRVSNDR
jgi:flagellar export protein FliJ